MGPMLDVTIQPQLLVYHFMFCPDWNTGSRERPLA